MANAQPAILTALAYDLLASQPVSSIGMSRIDRQKIVVSAVAAPDGVEHPLSLYGDAEWDLSPYCDRANNSRSFAKVSWPTDIPSELVDDAKAAMYAWFRRGTPGSRAAPTAGTACGVAKGSAIPFVKWLAKAGIHRFSEVKPIHISNYVHAVNAQHAKRAESAYGTLRILDLLWTLRAETLFPLCANPWGNSTLGRVCGIKGFGSKDGAGKTPIIPADVQAKIFNYCEDVIARSGEVLDRLEAGELPLGARQLIRVRDCGLYILSMTSGMRNDEAIGVEAGSWRSEIKDGVEYNWVRTIEHKTKKGKVEFLVPALTLKVLDVLVRYAKPLQARLANEVARLSVESVGDPAKMAHLLKARKDANKVFLSLSGSEVRTGPKRVEAMNTASTAFGFARIAKAAGVSWKLSPHQCRRTYARCIVESRMGRASLVFLKWQFKHTSMGMTQLYASNPMQDASIFDEILQEMTNFKIDLIESWMGDGHLSGGAGAQIKKLRAIPIQSREAMLADTAAQVHIRATGHGWCLAQERGCGGAGLYESTRCVGCKSGVIDESFSEVWKGIHEQQLELLKIDDAGPAVRQRAERDVKWTAQVMKDLGLSGASVAGLGEAHG